MKAIMPIGPVLEFKALADNAYVLQVLTDVGDIEDQVAAGEQAAETMIELDADLPPDQEFFEEFGFIGTNDPPEFVALLGRSGDEGTSALAKQDRAKLFSLLFELAAVRRLLDVLDRQMQHRLLEARKVFGATRWLEVGQQIELFDPERYYAAPSVQDNILFGRIACGEGDAPARIPEVLREVNDRLSLRQIITDVGLNYDVGARGRINPSQRSPAPC